MELIQELQKNIREQKAWDMWLARYQHMTKEDYISFEEFYNPKSEQKTSVKSQTEILKDVKSILDGMKFKPRG